MSKKSEYKESLYMSIQKTLGHLPEVYITQRDVWVEVESRGVGITYRQLSALRNIFQAEFNMEFRYADGCTSESGTYFPGEQSIIFTYQMKEPL